MIKEIKSKSVLRKNKKIDSWFMTHYAMNLYRGCTHDCVYCDGRSEGYYVDGDFGKDIQVKRNAIEILSKELDPTRKRKPMPKSFMMLGGGVCDAYQPVEKKYKLARQTLELIEKFNYPVHILTKGVLIERDLDLLKRINEKAKVIVSFSFSSVDDEISKTFEPNVAPPSERLRILKKFNEAGIHCGMFLMPVIPLITDSKEMMKKILLEGKKAGVEFVIFGSMTLKPGKQKEYFMKVLKEEYPELIDRYEKNYPEDNKWGSPNSKYISYINRQFNRLANEVGLYKRIPQEIFGDVLSLNDQIIVILEQLDYLIKMNGKKSSYGYAAYKLSKLEKEIRVFSKEELLQIGGIGPVTLKIINEIISTGQCTYYNQLMKG